MIRRRPRSPLFASTTLSRSLDEPRLRPLALRHFGGQSVVRLSKVARPLPDLRLKRVRKLPKLRPRLFEVGKVLRRKALDRKSTRLNSSHANISYAVFCLQ